MESWRYVFRDAVAPLVSTAGLKALEHALVTDDFKLVQGTTCQPPPYQGSQSWYVVAACALGYCGWKGDGLETVAEVEEYFRALCFAIDEKMGEPAGCRYFLNAFDEWPRDEMIANLLPEVQRELASRQEEECDHAVIVNA